MMQNVLRSINLGLLLPAAILLGFGLITLFSINQSYFRSECMFFVISLIVYFITTQLNVSAIKAYGIPLYIAAIIAFVIVLLLGFESHGAVRWIDIFGFRIQFSEIFKPFLAITLAQFLTNKKASSFATFISVIIFLFPIVLLIALQPDLGSAIIYLFVTVLALFIYGFPKRWFFTGLALVGVSLPILWHFLHGYQKQRIETFLHPSADPLGISYNSIQSVIAVGSGMITGKGIGQGTQSTLRFLPEQHTDFIFATISENLGFIGTLFLLVTFVFLLFQIYRIFQTTENSFARNFAMIAFLLLLVQCFMNIGMNTGILPIVGIPLPFVSYGGSSLLSNFILLGILTAVSSTARRTRMLEIK